MKSATDRGRDDDWRQTSSWDSDAVAAHHGQGI